MIDVGARSLLECRTVVDGGCEFRTGGDVTGSSRLVFGIMPLTGV